MKILQGSSGIGVITGATIGHFIWHWKLVI